MNPIIISTIIGVASFILTIFSATYLSQRHTDKLIEQLEKRFEARIDALRSELKGEIGAMGAELKGEIGMLRVEVANQSSKLDRIERQLEAIFKPVFPKTGD